MGRLLRHINSMIQKGNTDKLDLLKIKNFYSLRDKWNEHIRTNDRSREKYLKIINLIRDLASLVTQLVKICLQWRRPQLHSWVWKMPWRRDSLLTPIFFSFPGGSDDKESACNTGSLGSTPELGRSPGGGHGNQLQYSRLENPHGQRKLVEATVHGVTKSRTQPSD